ncbi:hypothetical protein [Halovivax cerinus]|uniref:N-acetyltransferase domain-containing protein n=1 Tax=Halovivax cerinus TaxID=1487865 RepID=A0ABD5NSD4_9EURY|nr:hypothetical protein [Halovivax cerinus]
MNVRTARESDAAALASLADVPASVIRTQIHDRTVRVAVEPSDGPTDDRTTGRREGATPSPVEFETESSRESVHGFVSFDAGRTSVFVTSLWGSTQAIHRLLDEPISFATVESMPVETVVSPDRTSCIEALLATGFEAVGDGPAFDGEPTKRYRLAEPGDSTRNDSSST